MRDPYVDFDPGAFPAGARIAALVLGAVLIAGGLLLGFSSTGTPVA